MILAILLLLLILGVLAAPNGPLYRGTDVVPPWGWMGSSGLGLLVLVLLLLLLLGYV